MSLRFKRRQQFDIFNSIKQKFTSVCTLNYPRLLNRCFSIIPFLYKSIPQTVWRLLEFYKFIIKTFNAVEIGLP